MKIPDAVTRSWPVLPWFEPTRQVPGGNKLPHLLSWDDAAASLRARNQRDSFLLTRHEREVLTTSAMDSPSANPPSAGQRARRW
jgi:hypothetical protein